MPGGYPCCCTGANPCTSCDGPYTGDYQVTIALAADATCLDCNELLNDTFVLSKSGSGDIGDCEWRFNEFGYMCFGTQVLQILLGFTTSGGDYIMQVDLYVGSSLEATWVYNFGASKPTCVQSTPLTLSLVYAAEGLCDLSAATCEVANV